MKKSIIIVSALLLSLTMASCSSPVTSVEGDLSLITAQSEAQEGLVPIGVAVFSEPGSGVWDSPDGVTIGRVAPGEYPVYGVNDGWLQIALAEGPNAAVEGYSFGWVQKTSTQLKLSQSGS